MESIRMQSITYAIHKYYVYLHVAMYSICMHAWRAWYLGMQ